jgi:hypothetical protein
MSAAPINLPLYRLLVKVGASEAEAEEAARMDTSALVTKADLAELKAATKADLAELKAELMKMNVGTLVAVGSLMTTV